MDTLGYRREHASERYKQAIEKAAEILAERGVFNDIEAYKLLVKLEDKIGYPVTYDLVLDALNLLASRRSGSRISAKLEVEA